MDILFLGCTLASLAIIVLMLAFSPRFHPDQGHARFSTLAFACWMVSTVIFTSYTFKIQLPGLPDINVERILLLIVAVSFVMRLVRGDFVRGQDKTLEGLMVLFCLLCMVSMARFGFVEAYPTFSRPSLIFQTGYVYPFLAFVYAKYFLDSERDMLFVFESFFWFGCYLALIAYLERFDLRGLVFPSYIVDPVLSEMHLDRSRGPFLNAAFNGLALNFAFICGMFVLPTAKGAKRLFYVLALLLYLPAIYFTRTRSVYLHFAMTLLVVMFLYKTKMGFRRLVPAVLLAVAVLVGVNLDTFSSSSREAGGMGQMKEVHIRMALAEKSRDLFWSSPIAGIGLAQFRTASMFAPKDVEVQHNHLIGMASELGISGVGVYLALLLVIFARLYHLVDAVPDGAFVNLNFVAVLTAGLFVPLVANVFVEPTLHLFANMHFFVLAGIMDQLYNRYALHKLPGSRW